MSYQEEISARYFFHRFKKLALDMCLIRSWHLSALVYQMLKLELGFRDYHSVRTASKIGLCCQMIKESTQVMIKQTVIGICWKKIYQFSTKSMLVIITVVCMFLLKTFCILHSVWIWKCFISIKHLNLNLNLKKVYSTEYSFAHCTIAVSKITKSSGDPY